MMEERLQKILAKAGFGSRRANEELIQAGRVKVNGVTATLGMKADPSRDTITVDTRPIPKLQTERIYIALHKPRGVLSDVDPNDDRQTVRDLVPVPGHLFAVGRLDYDSEGLILLTNDGDLANRLTHPRYGHEKEYRVLVPKRPDEDQLAIWRRGVVLDDGYKTAPAHVVVESTAARGIWLRVILREGRKRQIREVGSRIGLPVQRIVRVRIGNLTLGNLKPKEWRNLNMDEVKKLRALSDAPAKTSARPKPTTRYRTGNRTGHPPERSQSRQRGGWRDRAAEEKRPTSRRPRQERGGERRPAESSSPPGGPVVWVDLPGEEERFQDAPPRTERGSEQRSTGRPPKQSRPGGGGRPARSRRPGTGGRPSGRNKGPARPKRSGRK
jgi:23S rRNA pseudouridine2605 synthase